MTIALTPGYINESSIKNGGRYTGPNGVTIFLPAAGERLNSKLYMDRDNGIYWSSTHDPAWPGYAHKMGFYFSRSGARNLYERREGLSIRPVISTTTNINLPESSSDTSNQPIYNLYGIKVADNAADMNTLPPGIYIVNGKKRIVK